MARSTKFAALLLLALSTTAPLFATAQDAPKKDKSDSNADRMKADAEAAYANAPIAEQEVKSKGRVTVGGKSLGYTATVGTLTLRDTEGKPTASLFYTAIRSTGSSQAPGAR